jgi:hypothetical protein
MYLSTALRATSAQVAVRSAFCRDNNQPDWSVVMNLRVAALLLITCSFSRALTYEPLSKLEDPLIWGLQGNANSNACVVSGNGLTTGFTSTATQLVANDRNGFSDAFARAGSAMGRIGLRASGAEPQGRVTRVALSDSGRYVALLTEDDLLENQGGPNPLFELSVYWVDLQTNTMRLASKTLTGTRAYVSRFQVEISGNGRYVVFDSDSDQLVNGDSNTDTDVFRFDSTTDTVALVSSSSAAVIGNSDSTAGSIDDSGDWVAFESNASNLVPASSGNQVYVKQLSTGAILRASQTTAGVAAASAARAHIAGAAGFVVYESDSQLVGNDTDSFDDIYRHNLSTRTTERVSVSAFSGNAPNADSNRPNVSANGRFVWFESDASNFTATAPIIAGQIYRRDMANNTILQASNGLLSAFDPKTSDDGQVVCFQTKASLLPSDSNGILDVYRYSAALSVTEHVSIGGIASASVFSAYPSYRAAPALNASRALMLSDAQDLDRDSFLPSEFEGQLLDVTPSTGQISLIAPRGIEASSVQVTPDAQWATVDLYTNDLTIADTNNQLDTYRLNLNTGVWSLLSVGTTGSAAGVSPLSKSYISGTGNRVAFLSDASNLIATDTNSLRDVFLWQSSTVIRRINVDANGVEANGEATDLAMDQGGNLIGFSSAASNLVPGDTNASSDVFVRDLSTLTLTRVSLSTTGAQLSHHSRSPTISVDGRYIGYFQDALAPTGGFYIFDRTTQSTVQMQIPAGVTVYSDSLRFSQNPRYLIYYGLDANNTDVAYRYDRVAAAPNFELLRTSVPTANRIPRIYDASMANNTQAMISTDSAVAIDDYNNRSDVVLVRLQPGELSFTGTTINVAESAGTIDIPIQRLLGSDGLVGTASNFIALTADALDYTIVQANATWVSGDSGLQNLRLTIVDDGQVEANETLRVQLTAIDGGAIGALPGQVTITITDNDQPLIFANGFE